MGDQATSSAEAPRPLPPQPEATTLRRAQPGDADFLRALYQSTRAEELSVLQPSQREAFLEMQWRARQQDYGTRYPDAEDQIVVVAGMAAGRLLVARQSDDLVVVDIALLPPFQGRGIGSWLLKRLLAEAARTQSVVRLHVALSNPALRLYRRLGFSQVSESGPYALLERRTSQGAGALTAIAEF
jgi:ribosomal protein S18 acetylase RimI-like enzyme